MTLAALFEESKITAETWVPLGAMLAVIVTLVVLAWKGRGFLEGIATEQREAISKQQSALSESTLRRDLEFQRLTTVVEKLSTSVDGLARKLDGHITTQQSRLWLERFRRLNPTLNVPDLE